MWVQTVEVIGNASYGLSQCSHQLRLLNVLGFQCLCLILPKQQGAQCGLPAQGLSPHHLNMDKDRIYLFISVVSQ